jgi:hypothetical protein
LPPGAQRQPRSILIRRDIVHRIAGEQHSELGAGAAHRVREPDDGVVLFFRRGAISGLDDLQHFHGALLISSG